MAIHLKKAGLFIFVSIISIISIMLFSITLYSEAGGKKDTDKGKLKVFVSILPQAYFVERVGGEYVDVQVLVPPGQSPATYEPTPKQMVQLSGADVFFCIGVPFEKVLIPRIMSTMKHKLIMDTGEGIKRRQIDGGPDPHIWLSPMLVKEQAKTIQNSLIKLKPAYKNEFAAGYACFASDLDELHKQIAKALESVRGKDLFVFHPAFGYFADAYGLKQVAVETGGTEPGARQLARLIEDARSHGVKVIFVQPQFSPKSARIVAEAIGGAVVSINPLSRDYIHNLKEMADRVKVSLQ